MKAVTRSHVRTPAALLLRSGQTLLMNSREGWFWLLEALQVCSCLAWGADSQPCLCSCCDRHLGLNIGGLSTSLIILVNRCLLFVYVHSKSHSKSQHDRNGPGSTRAAEACIIFVGQHNWENGHTEICMRAITMLSCAEACFQHVHPASKFKRQPQC